MWRALTIRSLLAVLAASCTPRIASAQERTTNVTPAEVQARYGKSLYDGLVALRSHTIAAQGHLVGDNTGPWGTLWTKSANLGLDLVATLVAHTQKLVNDDDARIHVATVLDALSSSAGYQGLPPENLKLENGLHAEVAEGRVRYSSIDSAWVTVALSLVEAHYRRSDPSLSERAKTIVAKQNYQPFVRPDGFMGGGFFVDPKSSARVEDIPFSYGDRNSEARPLVNALVGMGKLPASAWDRMTYSWEQKDGLLLAQNWNWSAFAEMTGQLLMDEASLAPRSLGESHRNYIEASLRAASRQGHAIFGYAPACDLARGYTEYGLDRPTVVSPYAAAELALTGDPRAVDNLANVLQAFPVDGKPLADGLVPSTRGVYCPVSRTLDQALLFLSVYADTLRSEVASTAWAASAARRIADLDRTSAPRMSESVPRKTGSLTEPSTDAATVREPRPVRTESIARALARLHALLETMRHAQTDDAERATTAERQADLATSTTVATWLDLLPDFSFAVRRQGSVPAGIGLAPWWITAWGGVDLSVEKVESAIAAGDAEHEARAAARESERYTLLRGLQIAAATYLIERRIAALDEHAAALRAIVSGMRQTGVDPRGGEALVVTARLSAIEQSETAARAEKGRLSARLSAMTGGPFDQTGIDARLELADALALFGTVDLPAAPSDEVATADLAYQESLVRVAWVRAHALPDLRAGLLADFATGTPQATGGWVNQQLLGEVTAAARIRSGDAAQVEARSAGAVASFWRLQQLHAQRKESCERARARQDAALAAWETIVRESDSQSAYAHVVARFVRGECDARALVDASKTLIDEQDNAARLFAEAVHTQVGALVALECSHLLSSAREPANRTAPDFDWRSAADQSPSILAAAMEAARARARANGRRKTLEVGLEAGMLVPFRSKTIDAVLEKSSLQSEGTAALLPTPVLEPSLFMRLSMSDLFHSPDRRSTEAEAALRAVEATMVTKTALARQLNARLDLDYAREASRQAESRVVAATLVLSRLQAQPQGPLGQQAAVREAESRLSLARSQRFSALGALRESEIHLSALKGLPAVGSFEDQPGELSPAKPTVVSSLATAGEFYVAHGLIGFEATLRERIAELTVRWEEARLFDARSPPARIDALLQGTQGLEARSYSAGLSLRWRIDSPRNEASVLAATDRLGEARGQLDAVRSSLERERSLARDEIDAATEVRDLEAEERDRAGERIEAARGEQSSQPEVHEWRKAQTLASLDDQLFAAESRLLADERRLLMAHLRAMTIGLDSSTARPLRAAPRPVATSLAEAVARLVEHDPEVMVADERSRLAEAERLRPAVLGGLRALGPTSGASAGVAKAIDSAKETTITAGSSDVGVGVSYGLDEALAFLGTAPQLRAVKLAPRAARQRAQYDALQEIGSAWLEREQAKAAAAREAEMQRRVADFALPRFHAGYEGPLALAYAQSARAAARADSSRARHAFERTILSMAAGGVAVDDVVLDEFARFAVPGDPVFGADVRNADSEVDSDAGLQAAEAKCDEARAESLLSFVRSTGPVEALLEFAPFIRSDLIEQTGARALDTARGSIWNASLAVPLHLSALGRTAEAAFKTRLWEQQAHALARELRDQRAERGTRLAGALAAWHAAEERGRSARLAFEDVDRRYRSGEPGISAETQLGADDDVFEADRIELEARTALYRVVSEIRVRQGLAQTLMERARREIGFGSP